MSNDSKLKEIARLKTSILTGYRYIEDTPSLQPHIVASIEKRISAESDRLLALEDSLKEDIRRQEELEARTLNSVMYNWQLQ